VYRLAISITGNREDAEEAVQDTFLTLIARSTRFGAGSARIVDLSYRGKRRLPQTHEQRASTS
jgi:sigma-70-like protein